MDHFGEEKVVKELSRVMVDQFGIERVSVELW